MSGFEVGKTYLTRWGCKRKVVAIAVDGRLIVQDDAGNLSFRNSDGTCNGFENGDLIIPLEAVKVTHSYKLYKGILYRTCKGGQPVEFTFTGGKLTDVKLV